MASKPVIHQLLVACGLLSFVATVGCSGKSREADNSGNHPGKEVSLR